MFLHAEQAPRARLAVAGGTAPVLQKRVSRRRSRGRHAAPRRRRWPWVVGSLATVVVLAIGAVVGYGWYLNNEIRRVPVKDLAVAPKVGIDKARRTY